MKRKIIKPTAVVKHKDAAKFIESLHAAYDPDAKFATKNVESPVGSFYRAIVSKGKNAKALPDLIETATVMEVNRFGAYRLRQINGSDDFRKAVKEADEKRAVLKKIVASGIRFREASSFSDEARAECLKISESAKFREDFALAPNTNNPATDPFNEYIPLIGGPFSHQLYIHDFLDMLAKSFEAWNHNPLAHQIVKITTAFVLGRGVTFKAREPMVQQAFLKWWDECEMPRRLEEWSDMLSRDGELLIRCFVNPLTRKLFLRWVDPSTVWEIVSDLEDIEIKYYYHQQYPTAYQVLYGAPHGAQFDPTKFGSSKYVIAQIPAQDVYHVKINVSPNEKRGRSDLFSILGWLKRYKDFQTGVVLRAIMQSVFAWKQKLIGTDTDVQAFINQFGTDIPEFASVYVENEASDLQPMTADLKNGVGLADCPGVVNAIAVGSGIPKEYLGFTDHSTRATAVVASEPGVKKFQSRQLLLGRLLKDIAQRWADTEMAAGRLPRMTKDKDTGEVAPTDCTIEFIFPEIAIEDRTAKMADLQSALANEAITHEQYATAVAKELGIEDYNYADAQDEIADKKQEDLTSLYPKPAAPAPKPKEPITGLDKPAPQEPAAAPVEPPPAQEPPPKPTNMSGAQRRDIKQQNR